MQTSKAIVVVKKVPEAPIFELADDGIVGDVFTFAPQVTEEIKKREAQAARLVARQCPPARRRLAVGDLFLSGVTCQVRGACFAWRSGRPWPSRPELRSIAAETLNKPRFAAMHVPTVLVRCGAREDVLPSGVSHGWTTDGPRTVPR
jgi:hypothetical protein